MITYNFIDNSSPTVVEGSGGSWFAMGALLRCLLCCNAARRPVDILQSARSDLLPARPREAANGESKSSGQQRSRGNRKHGAKRPILHR